MEVHTGTFVLLKGLPSPNFSVLQVLSLLISKEGLPFLLVYNSMYFILKCGENALLATHIQGPVLV